MSLKFIIYPPICVCCNNVINLSKDFDDGYICDKCLKEARSFIESEKCFEKNKDSFYNENLSVLEYNEYFSKLLRKLKFGYNKNVASAFVKILEDYLIDNKDFFLEFDIITCVPIHKSRARYRGFNQSKLIGEKICEVVEKSFQEDVLIKVKSTYPQTTMPREQRENNIKDTFIINENINVKNKKILIIDDVFTTGSTINECAKKLVENGCKMTASFTVLKTSENFKKTFKKC